MITPRPEVAARLHELRFTRFLNLTKDIPKVKRECSWCGGPSNIKYCSVECTNEAYIRRGSDSVTRQVFKRDQGVCAGCGMDTCATFRDMHTVKQSLRDLYAEPEKQNPHDRRDRKRWRQWVRITRYPKWVRDQWGPWWLIAESPWEADHIIPVVEGGGCCGLDNYQTLCTRCHKEDTKALAGRIAGRKRAEKRRNGPQQELGL